MINAATAAKRKFETIGYEYFNAGKKDLAVFFPGMAGKSVYVENLTTRLSNFANVMFITSGYWGISRVEKGIRPEDHSLEEFGSRLNRLLATLKFRRLILLPGSLGTIHGINYFSRFASQIDIMLLDSPAILRRRLVSGSSYFLFVGLINVLLFLPEKLAIRLSQRTMNFFARKNSHPLNLPHMAGVVGIKSCLLGFKDVFVFARKNGQIIEGVLKDDKVHVFVGRMDGIYKTFCDQKTAEKCSNIQFVNCGHGIFCESPESAFILLREKLWQET